MIIQHNMMASFAERINGINNKNKATAMERLSSGYRINRAADDAAGLAISEKMRAQVRGLKRASLNIEDGLSLIQVADGALQDVHDILHRIRELAVQAANTGVYTSDDSDKIQCEIDCLYAEIDRIGDNTEFNKKKLFVGSDVLALDIYGNPINVQDIPHNGGFRLGAPVFLDDVPFSGNSSGSRLHLAAYTEDPRYAGLKWNLIYGSGSTSHSNLRMTYKDSNGNDVTVQCKLEDMTISGYNHDPATDEYSRVFTYTDGNGARVDITQKIKVPSGAVTDTGSGQYYEISYEISSNKDASIDFMFNADTAYNNNDRCEDYFIGTNRVNENCLYSDNSEYSGQDNVNSYGSVNWEHGFSIVDAEAALPFTENIKWDSSGKPDTVSFGNWGRGTGEWGYYDQLSSNLGGNTEGQDTAFSLIWNEDNVAAGTKMTVSFQYGIVPTGSDPNVQGKIANYKTNEIIHVEYGDLWIQSGANARQGRYIRIGEMNTTVLGLSGMHVRSEQAAGRTINAIDDAISHISEMRSILGAQYNGLSYMKAVDDVTAENLQMSESKLRDTDMAEEMAKFSTANILEQAGLSVLAQANRGQDSVLQLLQ